MKTELDTAMTELLQQGDKFMAAKAAEAEATTTKYWAQKGTKKAGPCASRAEAIEEYRRLFPFKGKDWAASNMRNQILTGYGEYGPTFDIRWHSAPLAHPNWQPAPITSKVTP